MRLNANLSADASNPVNAAIWRSLFFRESNQFISFSRKYSNEKVKKKIHQKEKDSNEFGITNQLLIFTKLLDLSEILRKDAG